MPLDPAKGSMNVLFAKPGIDPSQCRKGGNAKGFPSVKYCPKARFDESSFPIRFIIKPERKRYNCSFSDRRPKKTSRQRNGLAKPFRIFAFQHRKKRRLRCCSTGCELSERTAGTFLRRRIFSPSKQIQLICYPSKDKNRVSDNMLSLFENIGFLASPIEAGSGFPKSKAVETHECPSVVEWNRYQERGIVSLSERKQKSLWQSLFTKSSPQW